MAKKKAQKETDETVETQEAEFEYDVEAFTPVFNEERKEYDMYIFKLNIKTNQVLLEIEEMDYTANYRASSDLQQRQIKETHRQRKIKDAKK